MKFLVCVDCQCDFMMPEGALYSPAAGSVAPKIVNRIKSAIDNDEVVICTLDEHKKDCYSNSIEGKRIPTLHCETGTYGWSFIPELGKILIDEDFHFFSMEQIGRNNNMFKERKNLIIPKSTFSSDVIDTAIMLTQSYNNEEIEEIEICGVCTDICVISNALLLRSAFPDIRIAVNKELVAGTSDEATAAALKVMESCLIDII